MPMHTIKGRPYLQLRKRPWIAAAVLVLAVVGRAAWGDEPSRFPTLRPGDTHAHALLENAMRYVASTNGMVDPVSGYPFEGWNQDPSKGLYLRSFTQLTAIGQYMELLANVVAGYADTPGLSREQALTHLIHLVESLRKDQRDPKLGAKGLLVNFLDLATGKRLGPLASDVEKRTILAAFGADKGEAIWKALQAKGWIAPRNKDKEAEIRRIDKYGYENFTGPLAPFADEATKQKLMSILDERVVLVVFGDNSNLSTSAAKTIGALLLPEVASRPEVVKIRRELEQFLDDQREGYAHLYDAKAGLINFGWDASKDRLFGWDDPQGNWVTGHMDYFVNEFRGPATFVAARFGLPADAIGNLGFKMKPYRSSDGKVTYNLAPWEGSAFQAFGLGLSLGETGRPSWRVLLTSIVDAEIDFAKRKDLPGFLSESYTGQGVQYTGAVGIPELAVSPKPRITDAASLYCLGVAYSVEPEKVEKFLAANWPVISTLLTDHGPWEGYNIARREKIQFQTTAHTLSLTLGLLGTGSGQLKRYTEHKGITDRIDSFFPAGKGADLMARDTEAVAWCNKDSQVHTAREPEAFRVQGNGIKFLGIAFIPKSKEGVDLSGGVLSLHYRSARPLESVAIELKPGGNVPPGLISKQLFTRFEQTGEREGEIQIPLPATIGLSNIKEVVITHDRGSDATPIDVAVTGLKILPNGSGR
jgi:hypothetical protein